MKKFNLEEDSSSERGSVVKQEEIQCAKMLSDNWSPLKKQKISTSQNEISRDSIAQDESLIISLNLNNNNKQGESENIQSNE